MVFALEHADGTASCARLAGGRGWRFYKGLGGDEGQVEKTRHRMVEMRTAVRILKALHRGQSLPGLSLSSGEPSYTFAAGALDLRCLAAVGHSYGGATAAAVVAEDPTFRCGVCLDPWWAALPPEATCLRRWETSAPLFVMGSHDWNVPNLQGEVLCGPERQAKVFSAASASASASASNGGKGKGTLFLVIAGSSHNTFADPLALFSDHVGWVLRALGLSARLDQLLGIHLVNTAVLNFLSLYLPLTGDQRQLQTWTPSAKNGHVALDKVAQLERAGARWSDGGGGGSGGGYQGPLSWLFPGRGLLNAVSDTLLNRVLRTSGSRSSSNGWGNVALGRGTKRRVAVEDDVVTGEEVLEATMPSAEPSNGPQPHAPSSPLVHHNGDGEGGGGGREGVKMFDEKQRMALRSQVGCGYAEEVRAEHVDQFIALLGEEHCWKCQVF